MQKNWIGKSFGCEINFKIDNSKDNENIKVFTTRPDTIFGASFIAVSIDHPIAKRFEKNKEFIKFKLDCSKTGTTEEALANAEKIGFNSNLFVLHPLKGCDGCINWAEMGFGYSGFPGGPDRLVKDYYPEDKLTFGNNNGLQVFKSSKFTKFSYHTEYFWLSESNQRAHREHTGSTQRAL